MRGATQSAERLKQVLKTMRTKLGKVARPVAGDPITQLILGIFSRDLPESRAHEALEHLGSLVVDYNELRVIAPLEMADSLGDLPDVRLKCEDLSRALNRIFAIEHSVSLDRIAGLPKKDAQIYLDRVDGLEPYTRARIRLLGFQQHAIPLDEAMWAWSRKAGIVDPRCSLEEAQSFLERQVPAEEGLDFVALLKKQAWTELATAVRKGEVERIQSVPPDRTSRNMLQMIASGRGLGEADLPEPDEIDPELLGVGDEFGTSPLEPEAETEEGAGKSKGRSKGGKPRAEAKSARKSEPPAESAAPPKPSKSTGSRSKGSKRGGRPSPKARSA